MIFYFVIVTLWMDGFMDGFGCPQSHNSMASTVVAICVINHCLVFDGILDRMFTSNSQSMQGGEGGSGRVQGGRGRKEVHKRRLNLFLFGFA